jgi:hypothetical protein
LNDLEHAVYGVEKRFYTQREGKAKEFQKEDGKEAPDFWEDYVKKKSKII